jgi:hypothetical protein
MSTDDATPWSTLLIATRSSRAVVADVVRKTVRDVSGARTHGASRNRH